MNFQHEILFEIDTDAPKTDIKIIINNDIKWTQTSESKLQKYKATFEHNYDNAQKNILQISWTGKEVKRKQLKINLCKIHNKNLNIIKANYKPIINEEWLSSLPSYEQQRLKDNIYGNHGGNFGWYGDILMQFYTGADRDAYLHWSKNMISNDKLTGHKIEWIYDTLQ
tara:strand:+ start:641 stop:1144 length:504 start_codon:yes stop_codon:yes gene_type:complete